MRVADGGGGGGAHFVFAYYMTGYGLGRATRALEVVRQLIAAGHDVHVVTAAPAPEFEITSPRLHMREVAQVVLDCVAVEPDDLTVHRSVSLEAVMPRASILEREANWLNSIDADIVMTNPWRSGQHSDHVGVMEMKTPRVVRCGREDTPPPKPLGKRRRGRSTPPASPTSTPPNLVVARERSRSTPPSKERTRNVDAEVHLAPIAAVVWDIENCTVPMGSEVKNITNALSLSHGVIKDLYSDVGVMEMETPWVVRCGREDTPPPKPLGKRRRGRSTPPASPTSTPTDLVVARERSRSTPPKERTRGMDTEVRLAPIAVFWDIENCKVPIGSDVKNISENIRNALSLNHGVDSATITAYGAVPASVREGLRVSGVQHVGITNRKKDAADKLILTDMLLFARDNPIPACILLISGDADFAPAVRALVCRGYTMLIAVPSQGTAASDLIKAGTFVWDWPSLANGAGIVIRGTSMDNLAIVKANMVQLFQSKGGYIELGRIYSEYTKMFRKQLKLSHYSVTKLTDLFLLLGKPFNVIPKKSVSMDMSFSSTSGSSPEVVPASVVSEFLFNSIEQEHCDVVGQVVDDALPNRNESPPPLGPVQN